MACSFVTSLEVGCSLLVDTDELAVGSATPPGDLDASPADENRGADADAALAPLRPLEGTYAYLATGSDYLSFGDQTATWGPAARATVVHHGADCFTMSFNYREGFSEEIDYCAQRAELVETASRRSQSFRLLAGFITARTKSSCTPGDVFLMPAPTSDRPLTHLCTGENDDDQNGKSVFQSGGPYRFVGTEDVSVSGAAIRAFHFREERTVTGSQVGTSTSDWYFAVDRPIPVKLTKNTTIKFGAVNIDYAEKSELTLVSLVPSALPDAGAADAATDR